MYYDQSQKCPKAERCDDAPRSCEYCTLGLRAVCNFASSPHSIEHSNHEAYMQRIYDLPNHKPAGNFLLQITAKRYIFTFANKGNEILDSPLGNWTVILFSFFLSSFFYFFIFIT